eukprot:m.21264 g.21264  ORF g.21264 m.21264 type:complete len:424 (+) comp3910_c0_seq2:535-1806(+)
MRACASAGSPMENLKGRLWCSPARARCWRACDHKIIQTLPDLLLLATVHLLKLGALLSLLFGSAVADCALVVHLRHELHPILRIKLLALKLLILLVHTVLFDCTLQLLVFTGGFELALLIGSNLCRNLLLSRLDDFVHKALAGLLLLVPFVDALLPCTFGLELVKVVDLALALGNHGLLLKRKVAVHCALLGLKSLALSQILLLVCSSLHHLRDELHVAGQLLLHLLFLGRLGARIVPHDLLLQPHLALTLLFLGLLLGLLLQRGLLDQQPRTLLLEFLLHGTRFLDCADLLLENGARLKRCALGPFALAALALGLFGNILLPELLESGLDCSLVLLHSFLFLHLELVLLADKLSLLLSAERAQLGAIFVPQLLALGSCDRGALLLTRIAQLLDALTHSRLAVQGRLNLGGHFAAQRTLLALE